MHQDQALKVANYITQANYGSFASALAYAYLLADQDNRAKLLQAFLDLFQRIERDMVAYAEFTSTQEA